MCLGIVFECCLPVSSCSGTWDSAVLTNLGLIQTLFSPVCHPESEADTLQRRQLWHEAELNVRWGPTTCLLWDLGKLITTWTSFLSTSGWDWAHKTMLSIMSQNSNGCLPLPFPQAPRIPWWKQSPNKTNLCIWKSKGFSLCPWVAMENDRRD